MTQIGAGCSEQNGGSYSRWPLAAQDKSAQLTTPEVVLAPEQSQRVSAWWLGDGLLSANVAPCSVARSSGGAE
jgi:hypothetical protein